MNVFLNLGLAWVAVFISLLLISKFITKRLGKKGILKMLDHFLRKTHIFLGIILIIVGLVHGLNSSEEVLSLNLGTVLWIVSIILGLNFMLRKKLGQKKSWIFYHRILTVAFIVLTVIHVIDVGGIRIIDELSREKEVIVETTPPSDNTSEEVKTEASVVEEANKGIQGVKLKDGTYTGVADAYGPGLTVSVSVKDNEVTEIIVVSHNEDKPKIYERALSTIPGLIISSQSLEVEAVAGATFTSVGIMNAVNNALAQALIEGTLPPIRNLPY